MNVEEQKLYKKELAIVRSFAMRCNNKQTINENKNKREGYEKKNTRKKRKLIESIFILLSIR